MADDPGAVVTCTVLKEKEVGAPDSTPAAGGKGVQDQVKKSITQYINNHANSSSLILMCYSLEQTRDHYVLEYEHCFRLLASGLKPIRDRAIEMFILSYPCRQTTEILVSFVN